MRNFVLFFILIFLTALLIYQQFEKPKQVLSENIQSSYWFILQRSSNIETLFFGVPGEKDNSQVVRIFKVKSGIPGKRPTPLPQLLGRKYWLITEKFETLDSPETAPYFLKLDIPYSQEYPYGPTPYLECKGQCDWELPGSFGLHGVAGNSEKLTENDLGSSGCIRHSHSDITYLYNLLNPKKEEIRYYIEES